MVESQGEKYTKWWMLWMLSSVYLTKGFWECLFNLHHAKYLLAGLAGNASKELFWSDRYIIVIFKELLK